jgi:PTH1 family peptidyl-tRNA hydrolase
MLLIVGLGNPGRRYAGNRHNVGFMAADEIHRRHRFAAWRARFEGELSEGLLGGEKALILKPATYMNESGRAVGQAMRFFKLAPADVLVIYDELDLPPGKLRMKAGGGTAGHKGLRSIEAHIGRDFRRMRIGIGHPGARELVNSYVLHDFAKADQDWLQLLLSAIADNAPLLAKGEDSSFMNRVHLAVAASDVEEPAVEVVSGAAAIPKPERRMGSAFADSLKKLIRREH